ncbi:MAG: peptidoglycan DD-metalloendopeptidase family protein [candidate division Zixibacteria bacterium]|nr:peptidoglycan DD-metalloendopeptidase family protein [candidate division Zixibacteria bacterium]
MKLRRITYWLLALTLAVAAPMAQESEDVKSQRKELEKIQQDVKRSRQRLDSLRQEEGRVQKALGDYDRRLAKEQQTLEKLNRDLKRLQRNIGDAESQLGSRQQTLDLTRRRFLGSLRQFYLTTPRVTGNLVDVPTTEYITNRKMIYLTALVNFEQGNVVQASHFFDQSLKQLSQLESQQGKVSKQKKRRESNVATEQSRKQKQEKALDKLVQLKQQESDRITMLEQAAREMEQIVARLEAKQKKKAEESPETQYEPTIDFVALRGLLRPPFRGEITVRYGAAVDPITKLRSFSPGITIKGEPGGNVTSVAAGQVAYTGSLRGYGNFVIINHDNQHFTTYAGLSSIYVTTDQLLKAGDIVGAANNDGIVKFELRKGRQSLNPAEWIRM